MSDNQNGQNFFDKYINTPDQSYAYDPQDIQHNKVWAALSYVGILWILPLLVNGGHSPYARFHANQGLILFVAAIVAEIVAFFVSWIPLIGTIVSWVLQVLMVAYMVLGIINGATGKVKTLPFIGNLFHALDR